ncbi:MAG: hypothetical protein JNG85_05450, partial [Spirochaetaceae bacterium]|nr:hypothetical protein [Spirochaetaceae bacterium]
MSGDNKKLIWISAAVCGFILVLAVAGLFLFAPQKGGAAAPATLGNVAAPKAVDPQDFLQAPPPAPSLEAPRAEGEIIGIFGDKPAEIQGGGAGVAAPSGTAPAVGLTGAAAPTAPQPAAEAPKP